MEETPDSVLIQHYLEGDIKAFDALLEKYRAKIFSFIARMVRNRSDAEDLFQETFFRVIRELPRYHEVGKFRSYLFQVAHNACLDHIKRAENRLRDENADIGQFDDEQKPGEPRAVLLHVEESIYQNEMKVQLQNAIDSLPDAQREVVLLRFYSDLSFKEIAEVVASPLNTVLGRMHYALKHLKELMGESLNEII